MPSLSPAIASLVTDAALKFDVPVELVSAMVLVESSGNPWAFNPEPRYRYLWNIETGLPFRALTPAEISSEAPPDDFPAMPGVPRDAEWWGQQASWGLLQVMGAVAREYGFGGLFLVELCEPWVGLDYGVRHLRHQMNRYGGNLRDAVVAYNTGNAARDETGSYGASGQRYLLKVSNACSSPAILSSQTERT